LSTLGTGRTATVALPDRSTRAHGLNGPFLAVAGAAARRQGDGQGDGLVLMLISEPVTFATWAMFVPWAFWVEDCTAT